MYFILIQTEKKNIFSNSEISDVFINIASEIISPEDRGTYVMIENKEIIIYIRIKTINNHKIKEFRRVLDLCGTKANGDKSS